MTEGISKTREDREHWEAQATRWTSISGAGIPGLGFVPVFILEDDPTLERIIARAREDDLDHDARFILFKQSSEVASEYLHTALELRWLDINERLVLFFTFSEDRLWLKSMLENGGLLGFSTKKLAETGLSGIMLLGDLPLDVLSAGLAALEDTEAEHDDGD